MKKYLILLATLILCVSSSALAHEIELPHIAVTGTAKKMVTPDQIAWSVYVANKGAALRDVADTHAGIVGRVIAFLKEEKIEPEKIQTSRMRFGENWEYRNNTRVKEGYFAHTDITFKQTNFKKYIDIWMGLARFKDVYVGNAVYELSDPTVYQKETRKEAMLAAREKAMAMAAVLGSRIGEPIVIEEDLSVSEPPRLSREAFSNTASFAAGGGAPGGAQVAPGQIPVRIRVKVIFRLINSAD